MQLPDMTKRQSKERGKSVNLAVGQRIKVLREQKGLTQESMGDALGIPQTLAQKFEIGMCFSNIYRLIDICAFLGCTLNDLAATLSPEQAPGYGVDTAEAKLMKCLYKLDDKDRRMYTTLLELVSSLS